MPESGRRRQLAALEQQGIRRAGEDSEKAERGVRTKGSCLVGRIDRELPLDLPVGRRSHPNFGRRLLLSSHHGHHFVIPVATTPALGQFSSARGAVSEFSPVQLS